MGRWGPAAWGRSCPDTTMKVSALILAVAFAVAGCVAYAPQPGPAPKGGPGNNYCPPGQAKKGNC